MLHILLVILKILFFLLAFVLLSVLGILLLVLFVPIHYEASASKENILTGSSALDASAEIKMFRDVRGQGSVHWLLHLLHLSFTADRAERRLIVRVFGYAVIGGEKKEEKKNVSEHRETPVKTEPDKADDTIQEEAESQLQETRDDQAQERPESEEGSEALEDSEYPGEEAAEYKEQAISEKPVIFRAVPSLIQTIGRWIRKIENSFRHLSETLRNIKKNWQKMLDNFDSYKRLWYDEHTGNAWRHIKKEIRYLLRHFRPRRLKGSIVFGFGDPAQTGQALGVLYMLQSFLGSGISFEPDFEKVRLEGDISMKGRLRLCHMVKAVLALLLDRNMRITIKRFRKMQGRT